jgi:hypothetical protein
MKRLFASMTFSLVAVAAFATTYVRVEKDGTKTYSDRPIPGGQPIEVQSAQTYSAPPAASAAAGGRAPREQQLLQDMGDTFRYESCVLTPGAEQTFTNPESVSLGVQTKPPLRAGDVIDLRLDGAQVAGDRTQSYVLKPVPRGAHTLAVTVKDGYGRQLCGASSVFHVFQPSLNSPARQAPPKPRRGG